MSLYEKMYKYLQDSNPEKFKPEVMNLKEKDNPLQILIDACESLEIIDGITFLGARKLTSKNIYEYQKEECEVDYEDSRIENFEIKFLLEKKDERQEITKIIAFPKLLNGCYYLIDDVTYYPIFQLIDAETYKTNKSITMRTALQPIIVKRNKTEVEDEFGTVIENIYCFSGIFYVKLPIFLYYFAKFGVLNTIKYFNLPFELFSTEDELNEDDYVDDLVFRLGKKFVNQQLYLKVPFSYVDEDENPNYEANEIMLLTFLNAFGKKDKIPYEMISNKDYWLKKLGSNFTKNTSNWHDKGQSVIKSFERLFDNTTKKMIRLEDVDKKDIYSLVRWFLINYNNLMKMNNNDLANKRLRLSECFIYPLQEHWTRGVLRLINSKNVTVGKMVQLFSSIKPDFLLKNCVNDENSRYSNLVNTLDVCSRLKITSSGPQSISTNNGEIKGKDIDPSMIGNIDIVYTSNADPGTTRMLTPFATLNDTWHFSDKPNIIANSFDGDDMIDEEEEYEDEEYEDIFNE